MTINEKQDELIDELSGLDDWMDRYSYIIDLGNQLPAIDESLKTPSHLIEGCQSRVWLDARLSPEGKVEFTADSDAIIVKGIISMLIDVLNGHTPQEILDADGKGRDDKRRLRSDSLHLHSRRKEQADSQIREG